MEIDNDLLGVIISSVVTLTVGGIGAGVGYKASIKGAKMQIDEERKKLRKESEEQQKAYREAMEKFISIEIRGNFLFVNKQGTQFMKDSLEGDTPSKHTHNIPKPPGGFAFKEYDKLKYELIKVGGQEVKDIIDIYEMFYLVSRKEDISTFTKEEYDLFKKGYFLCLNKYYYE